MLYANNVELGAFRDKVKGICQHPWAGMHVWTPEANTWRKTPSF